MTRKKPANMAASVRQRLLNKARTDKRPFNELLQYFAEVTAFSDDFVQNKSSQWKAFRNKLRIDTIPTEFVDVVALLRKFIVPITEKIRSDAPATDTWIAPGPWQ